MHTIQIDDDTYQVPADWDELTPDQLRYLARLTREEQPIEQLKLLMLLYCLRARVARHPKLWKPLISLKVGSESPRVRIRIGRKSYWLTPEEVNLMADQLAWLVTSRETSASKLQRRHNPYAKQDYEYYLQPLRTVNPCPVLRIRLHRLKGPDDNLFDITFEQYMYLQTYLDGLAADPAKLDSLLACLWHTGRRFDINRLEHDARLIRRLPAEVKMMLYWFILGSIQNFADCYPRVFSGGSGKIAGNVLDSQFRLLDSLAAHDMTKKDDVRRGLFIDALYAMDEQLRIQEEMKEKMQKR